MNSKVQLFQIFLTVCGWFAAFGFGVLQQRRSVQNGVKMKVFEEFWRQRNILQDNIASLASVILNGPPFEVMKSTEVYGSVTRNPEDIWKGQQDAIKFLNTYMGELFEATNKFSDTYLNFMRSFEMWLHVMPALQKAAQDLFDEYTSITQKINEHYTFLQMSNVYQWKEWDQSDIKRRCEELFTDLNEGIKMYTEDIMTLIHNELLHSFFNYQKEVRKPSNDRVKVLTLHGLTYLKSPEEQGREGILWRLPRVLKHE